MYDPVWTDRPAVYELSFKDASVLLIRIHRLGMNKISAWDINGSAMAQSHRTQFGFGPFVQPTGDKWGFRESLLLVPSSDPDWQVFQCSLPVLAQGDENKWADVRSQMNAIRATLECVFTLLSLFDQVTNSKQHQLMVVEGMRVEPRTHGGSISIMFTPALVEWLLKFDDREKLPEVEKALFETYSHIRGGPGSYGAREFRAHCRTPGRLYLSIPGSACELTPDVQLGHEEHVRGYTMCPHNIDSGMEQLTFLMGLARLHDLARQGMTQ